MMSETTDLIARGLCSGAFDLAAAWACGVLLTKQWLRRSPAAVGLPKLAPAAAVMMLALATQFLFLVANMAGSFAPAALRANYHDVAGMTAGDAILSTLAEAAALFAVAIWRDSRVFQMMQAFMLTMVLWVHAGVGHAAAGSSPLKLEALEFVHVASMAVWAGGVLLAGLAAASRLAAVGSLDAGYLRSLSRAAQISVALALATGGIKGWLGLDGHIAGLWHSAWGIVLSVKIVLVCVALVLGLVHWRWIRARDTWTMEQTKAVLTTMRVEAFCLAAVILLSGFLGNLDPA